MAVLVSMLALVAPIASARSPIGQDAAKQEATKEEAEAYKLWYEANQAKDIPKAVGFAKTYLEKFPTGQFATYLKGWIRPHLFNEAMKGKNTGEMIRLGKEQLAAEPENLDYLYLLAVSIQTNELFASPPNYSHAAEVADFSQRAIKLIEGGKVPQVVPKETWKQGPSLALLYSNLALVEAKNKNGDKAIGYYEKAATLDPSSASYFLQLGVLYQEKYQSAAKKYQDFPEADRQAAEPKPEVKGALDEANAHADKVIDNWARFMALTASVDAWKTTRDQVSGVLTNLYNYRHPDSPDGLQKLIEKYKTNGAPATTSAAATTSKA
jgi:tetratricopeptide (TPR) repeat protein